MLGEVKQIEADPRRLTAAEFSVARSDVERPEIDFEAACRPLPLVIDEEDTA